MMTLDEATNVLQRLRCIAIDTFGQLLIQIMMRLRKLTEFNFELWNSIKNPPSVSLRLSHFSFNEEKREEI